MWDSTHRNASIVQYCFLSHLGRVLYFCDMFDSLYLEGILKKGSPKGTGAMLVPLIYSSTMGLGLLLRGSAALCADF